MVFERGVCYYGIGFDCLIYFDFDIGKCCVIKKKDIEDFVWFCDVFFNIDFVMFFGIVMDVFRGGNFVY